jgi:hypothetical protein
MALPAVLNTHPFPPAGTPWYLLQILCYANHAAAVEAAQLHLPLLLRAIAALRIGIAAHPSDYDDIHRVCQPCGRQIMYRKNILS